MATERRRPTWYVCVWTALTLLCAGCGTIRNLTEDTCVYGGVCTDVFEFSDAYERAPNVIDYTSGMLCMIVDMPLSAIGDTLTLPYVIPASLGWFGNRSCVPENALLRPSVDGPPAAK